MTDSARGSNASFSRAMLTCRAGTRLCAFELASVVETMRPLHVDASPGVPDFVVGVSRIRGEPVPVVDLCRLLGIAERGPANRFVLLRVGSRHVAVRVESVLGIGAVDDQAERPLPPLLRDARDASVTALAERDAELLLILSAAKLLPNGEPLTEARGGT
jgi:purine-binding chemotaxis protein CheW